MIDTNLFYELLRNAASNKSSSIDLQMLLLILAAVSPTLTALIAYLKVKSVHTELGSVQTEVKGVKTELKDVHLSINSRLDGWLEKARQDGVLEERKNIAAAAAAAALAAVSAASVAAAEVLKKEQSPPK